MKLAYNVFYTFFAVLELLILAYVIASFSPPNNKLRKTITRLVTPLLDPVRYLLNNSIFKTNTVDFSPIISFVIVTYLQKFFHGLI